MVHEMRVAHSKDDFIGSGGGDLVDGSGGDLGGGSLGNGEAIGEVMKGSPIPAEPPILRHS